MDNFFTTILIFFIIDSREKNNKSILDMAKRQTGQNFLTRAQFFYSKQKQVNP